MVRTDGGRKLCESINDKLFVAQMRGMADYERKMTARKAKLFDRALGGLQAPVNAPDGSSSPRVVEVGVGRGTNFAKLKAAGVNRLTAIEPTAGFIPPAQEAAEEAGMELEVKSGFMEKLPFPDASVDVVVATLVLCSVTSVVASLKEVRRVLRPGGRYIFTEHVAAPDGTWLRAAQDFFNPLQQWSAGGCRLNRLPLPAIQAEFGAAHVNHERFMFGRSNNDMSLPSLSDAHFLLAPHVAGYAEKRT